MTDFNNGHEAALLKIQRIANDLLGVDADDHAIRDQAGGHSIRMAPHQCYAFRRRREKMIDAEIFGEPAWDILLDLYEAHQIGRPIAVTSACIGAAVPPTTALRWINVLTERGHIQREEDPGDARRSFVKLTASTIVKLDQLFGRQTLGKVVRFRSPNVGSPSAPRS